MKNEIQSFNPATGEVIWIGEKSSEAKIAEVVKQAIDKQTMWNDIGLEKRKEIIQKFAQVVSDNSDDAAKIISEENGKPFWEAKGEVKSLTNKVKAAFEAYDERAKSKTKIVSGKLSVTKFRPHGVMAVLGPFNFPMSMSNSHIMPSLLAGNTVIFKPSERVPKSAEYYVDMWKKAGLPTGVLQIIHGDGKVGESLISQPGINGVLFIGSRFSGVEIKKKLAQSADKICALEMGGNNPLVLWDYEDVRAAIHIAIQSGYISSGQRCSSARRLILNRAKADEFIPLLISAIQNITVGHPFDTNPEPFMGPLIDNKAVECFLSDYNNLLSKGAKVLVPCKKLHKLGENFVSPALLDVSGVKTEDKEIFGPLLQLLIVDNLEQAIFEANSTQYGLTSGIVTCNKDNYENFYKLTKAGIINWNQPLTGATTAAPFGGVKASGNYRPAGYLSVDYCSYACASLESDSPIVPEKLPAGLNY
jgi:succinylglutamic semialdehyde dehydrogenase